MSPEEIKHIRKTLGDTQEEFACRLGYSSRAYICNVEAGRKKLSPPALLLLEQLQKKAEKMSKSC